MSAPSFLSFASLYLAAGALAQIFEDPYTSQSYYAAGNFSWPSASAWTVLNDTVSGRLQALRPWAAVCYTDDPLYDLVECQAVLSGYTNGNARESTPSALLWANWESCGYDNGCALNYSDPQPVSGRACHQGTTPPYSIAITSAEDASEVVRWASANNVKLTIKNTGHDFLGRSTGPSSLQVFTHHLKGVTYVTDFVSQGSPAIPVPALTISAGAQLEDIYVVAEANNVSVVLGGCLTVGAAGGYIQGGGHSVLSPIHGLAVDHLLEVEIVTADGVIRTINAAQDPDLFWAVRGGGAGSWGIIISITIATLPPTTISSSSLVLEPNATQDLQTLGVNFIALLGKYQNLIIDSGITITAAFIGSIYAVSFMWPAGHVSVSTLYPLFDEIRALSSNYTVVSNFTQESMYSSHSIAVLEDIGPSADAATYYGGATELSSRFVPRSVLETAESIQRVAEAIWEGVQIAAAPMEGNPPGVFNPQIHAALMGHMPVGLKQHVNDTAANPAFYDAAWHVMYLGSWTVGASQHTQESMMQAVRGAVGPLAALGLKGSYQNEGSAWEPNWKEAFFGYKYDQLLQIKRKYDSTNFFTTHKGVGFDMASASYACYQAAQPKSE
ncbi:hypothetical protein JVU11DRAFT_1062 [Chiua virens]|nr:hypothetical protein JVU11DRAFT_1062 [Chiua virens]